MCGTRVRGGRRGYLSGTVAEKLLARHATNVMAIRVVHPGLLGVAHAILVAFIGVRPPFRSALPFLDLITPEVRRLHILNAFSLPRIAYRHLTHRRLSKLRADGLAQARDVEQAVMETIGLTDTMVDSSVRMTDDWAGNPHPRQSPQVAADLPGGVAFLHRRPGCSRQSDRAAAADAPCDVALFRGVG